MEAILVVSITKTVMLQAREFFELEKRVRYLQEKGWRVERFPRFTAGEWRVALSRTNNEPLDFEAEQPKEALA